MSLLTLHMHCLGDEAVRSKASALLQVQTTRMSVPFNMTSPRDDFSAASTTRTSPCDDASRAALILLLTTRRASRSVVCLRRASNRCNSRSKVL